VNTNFIADYHSFKEHTLFREAIKMTKSKEDKLKIVISGSFRKHYSDIRDIIRKFENLDIQVLSPQHSNVVDPEEDFVLLETDKFNCPETLERAHLNEISKADALYLYNPEGYIGPSSAMELGWALSLGKPIFAREICKDSTLKHFVKKIDKLEEIASEFIARRNSPINMLSPQSSLNILQNYVKQVAAQRGFDNETPRDKVLLMLEEFGELAKAMRKYIGLKMDKDKSQSYTELKHEFADILFYLLDLSNACGIDLFHSFQEKEMENVNRKWHNS